VAQERAAAWSARKIQREAWVHFTWQRKSVCVNHYYIYVIDREWGPAFIKVCGYAPYALKLCLNGHGWVKRQLQRRRLRFTALDNGLLDCANQGGPTCCLESPTRSYSLRPYKTASDQTR